MKAVEDTDVNLALAERFLAEIKKYTEAAVTTKNGLTKMMEDAQEAMGEAMESGSVASSSKSPRNAKDLS